jgi:hypothetical protein
VADYAIAQAAKRLTVYNGRAAGKNRAAGHQQDLRSKTSVPKRWLYRLTAVDASQDRTAESGPSAPTIVRDGAGSRALSSDLRIAYTQHTDGITPSILVLNDPDGALQTELPFHITAQPSERPRA